LAGFGKIVLRVVRPPFFPRADGILAIPKDTVQNLGI